MSLTLFDVTATAAPAERLHSIAGAATSIDSGMQDLKHTMRAVCWYLVAEHDNLSVTRNGSIKKNKTRPGPNN